MPVPSKANIFQIFASVEWDRTVIQIPSPQKGRQFQKSSLNSSFPFSKLVFHSHVKSQEVFKMP